MLKRLSYFLLLFFSMFVVFSHESVAGQNSLQLILEGIDFYQSTLSTGKMSFTNSFEFKESNDISTYEKKYGKWAGDYLKELQSLKYRCDSKIVFDLQLLFSENKWLFDCKYTLKNEERVPEVFRTYQGFNGELLDVMIYSPSKEGIYELKGSTNSDKYVAPFLFDPRYNAMDVEGTSLGDFLAGKTKKIKREEIRLLNNEHVDGVECNRLSCYSHKNNITYDIWIAPDLNYNIVKMIITYPDDVELRVLNTYAQIDSLHYFPVHKQNTTYVSINNKKLLYLYNELISDSNDIDLNLKVTNNDLLVPFEPGMEVYDFKSRKSYIVSRHNE